MPSHDTLTNPPWCVCVCWLKGGGRVGGGDAKQGPAESLNVSKLPLRGNVSLRLVARPGDEKRETEAEASRARQELQFNMSSGHFHLQTDRVWQSDSKPSLESN